MSADDDLKKLASDAENIIERMLRYPSKPPWDALYAAHIAGTLEGLLASNRALNERLGKARPLVDIQCGCTPRKTHEPECDRPLREAWLAADDAVQRKD